MSVSILILIQICLFILSGVSLNASSLFVHVHSDGFVIFSGVLFWTSLISAVLMSFILRKKLIQQYSSPKTRPGIVRFFRNVESVISMSVFGTCVLFIILNSIFKFAVEWLTIFAVSIGLIAFFLHCLFDGENYQIYKDHYSGGRRR